MASSPLFVVNDDEDIAKYRQQVMSSHSSLSSPINGMVDRTGMGVYVQTSTLGSMEVLLNFLKNDCKVPVSGIRIGPVHKKDVTKASIMLEHKREYAVILAFDVPVTKDARTEAKRVGVLIFESDVIYQLFDRFSEYVEMVLLLMSQFLP